MRIACLIAAVFLTVAAPGRPQAKEDLAEEISAAHELMKRRKWSKARAALTSALVLHEGRDYVWAKKREILEDIKRCDFNLAFDEPEYEKLISGELLSYNERTGKIKLRYTNTGRDFAAKAGIRVHRGRFAGPYTITIKGDSYPSVSGSGAYGLTSGTPSVFVCDTGTDVVSVTFGQAPPKATAAGTTYTYFPARLQRYLGKSKRWEPIDYEKTTPVRAGKPFRLKVQVGARAIRVSYNGKVYLRGKKPKDVFGSWGISSLPFHELVASGRMETAWLQGLVDEKRHEQLARFEKSYEMKEVPAWILGERPIRPSAAGTGKKRGHLRPKGLTSDQRKVYDHALDLSETTPAGALTFLESRVEDALPEVARLYVLASCHHMSNQLDLAKDEIGRVCSLDPDFYWGHWRRALIFFARGETEEACRAVEDMEKRFPLRLRGLEDFCFPLMAAGQAARARSVIRRMVDAGIDSERVRRLDELLFKAEKGPSWSRCYEHESRFYRIVSDIDKKTCIEAGRVLDRAYLAYSAYLRGDKADRSRRFQVYLFAGKAGYLEYSEDVTGSVPRHTAGLYSPLLKQLLIWNLPDRRSMMDTVQHEGFHQYLDAILPTAPVWLNEGMAEYYERADSGTWNTGIVRHDHLRTLGGRVMPLEKFLFRTRRQFYETARKSYAQAWAIVHFLRHSSYENGRLFKSLIAALRETKSNERALKQVFGQVDLAELTTALTEHLEKLGE